MAGRLGGTPKGVRVGKAVVAGLIVAAAAVGQLLPSGVGVAHAVSCADVQLLFARGTNEVGAPIGLTGQALHRSLQLRFAGKDVRVSPVRYAASGDFQEGVVFLRTVAAGVRNAQRQIKTLTVRCPQARIVVGGYSQGAVVVTYAVSDQLAQVPAMVREVPAPLPSRVASHVASVVVFGQPSDRWFRDAHVPPMRVGRLYRTKVRDYCIPGDPICDGAGIQRPKPVHGLYAVNGMTAAAAAFTATRL
ncbi:cutinase family protein [Gordonia alkaliphila]|uniref:cutinase family protein n=1 Tax=Gordonia alkaliphila TaxID=1053547 RepID=UPI001FF3F172|nr:cutinase family protein [Gordonia alkaliphila]MCK0441241.1 cutinase family protein [Gordonia alkaliphila]